MTKMLEYYHDKELIGRNLGLHDAQTGIRGDPRCAPAGRTVWRGCPPQIQQKPVLCPAVGQPGEGRVGKPVCVMVSFIDITDKKQMEMAKRKALEQIEQNIEQFAILGDHIRTRWPSSSASRALPRGTSRTRSSCRPGRSTGSSPLIWDGSRARRSAISSSGITWSAHRMVPQTTSRGIPGNESTGLVPHDLRK